MSTETHDAAATGNGTHADPALLHALRSRLLAARRHRGVPTAPHAPSGPQIPRATTRSGPSPWLIVGGAFAVGFLTARAVAWRAHAHPRG